ncbi:hypothetical protein TELCIR_08458 [Teladorsagia circumcincta]|uniref:Uncharacterized protein n=1 Tax=Teladorsagia circumcincta TaxID=45464 RepID=A0A2G9UHI3_TELCI|nr:hypothetical protein TELCIR_08458 [Teladorsagia circumcincta]
MLLHRRLMTISTQLVSKMRCSVRYLISVNVFSLHLFYFLVIAFRVPGARDNMETTDMDLDDDSAPIDSQQFVPQANTAVAPPTTGQPLNFAMGQNLSVPPPIATQPPPNIQALLKSIPSLQTIQQATAAAAAAAAAAANNQHPQQNLPQMNYPPPVTQQRFGDVDERVQPIQPIQTPVQPIQQVQPIHPVQPIVAQPPPGPAPNFQLPPPRSQQPIYAEEGPSHIDYQPAGTGGDHEHHNGDNNYYGEGGRDGFYQKPPPGQFHNSGNYPPPGRGRPRGGGFYGHGGRGDQWRKS